MNQTESSGVLIPKWFVWMNATALGILGPVILSIAGLLFSMNNKLTILETNSVARRETVTLLRERVNVLQEKLIDHMADPMLHHAGLSVLKKDLQSLERRISVLEKP